MLLELEEIKQIAQDRLDAVFYLKDLHLINPKTAKRSDYSTEALVVAIKAKNMQRMEDLMDAGVIGDIKTFEAAARSDSYPLFAEYISAGGYLPKSSKQRLSQQKSKNLRYSVAERSEFGTEKSKLLFEAISSLL